MITQRSIPRFIACAVLAIGLLACSESPTNDDGDAYLSLSISPIQIPADGTTADVVATANSSDSEIGLGEVTFSAATGSFNGVGPEYTVELSNGSASVKYACDARQHANCEGQQRITAVWNDLQKSKTIQISPLTFSLELSASKDTVYPAKDAYIVLSAQLGETTNTSGSSGQQLLFSTTLGQLSADADGAEFENEPVALTDENGVARIRLYPGTSLGEAQVTAKHATSGASDTVSVFFVRNDISVSASPNSLFVGNGESTTLEISLRDSDDNAIASQQLRLTTTLGSFTSGTGNSSATTSTTAITDTNGMAYVTLYEQGQAGTATVTIAHDASAASATIAIDFLTRGLSITSSDPEVFSGSATPAILTATLRDDSFQPVANAELTFTTTLGLLSANYDGAAQSATISGRTNSEGMFELRFYANDAQGTAIVEVKHLESNATAKVEIQVISQKLTLQADKQTLYGGNTSNVTATLRDANDNAIAGQKIIFSTSLGTLSLVGQTPGSLQSVETNTDSQGNATVVFNASNTGTAIITATQPDNGLSRTINIEVTGNVLEISSNRPSIFSGVGDELTISATLKNAASGEVIPFKKLLFSTNLGGFTQMGAFTDGTEASVEVQTNAKGVAQARLTQLDQPQVAEDQLQPTTGLATITVTHAESGTTGTHTVEFVTVNQISHYSTTCNGEECTLMGIRGSGFNEQALVTFIVRDSMGNPAANVPVTFSISNPPKGTEVTTSGVSNAQGLVSANVTTGQIIGVFNVHAVVNDDVETRSPNIGIRGITPSNRNFTFMCDPVNQTVLATPYVDQPIDATFSCKVKLSDRYGNPIGVATPIQFKTEAGSIPNAATTMPYETTGDNVEEGAATVYFNTWGGPAVPRDVAPLEVGASDTAPTRSNEPWIMADGIKRNPRDGLVTLIAYARGEEFFHDLNGDGIRSDGSHGEKIEPFYDQGEPFVDANDNGTWDEDELYVDVNGNNSWDGPNGKHDADTTIWTITHVLYTGYVKHSAILSGAPDLDAPNLFESATGHASEYGRCLSYGSSDWFALYFADQNLNRVQADHELSGKSLVGTLNVVTNDSIGHDGFGFGIQIGWFDGSGNSCNIEKTNVVCTQKVRFLDWDQGLTGGVYFANPATPPDDPANQKEKGDTLRTQLTVFGQTTVIDIGGCTMQ